MDPESRFYIKREEDRRALPQKAYRRDGPDVDHQAEKNIFHSVSSSRRCRGYRLVAPSFAKSFFCSSFIRLGSTIITRAT